MKRLNPFSWSKRTILTALLVFYAIFIPTFLFFGFQPSVAASEISGRLKIPAISRSSDVVVVEKSGKTLQTPDFLVGSFVSGNKTFLFAHSDTAFKNLASINLEDEIFYNSEKYLVTHISTAAVTDIDMGALLKNSSEDSLVLMTCAGTETDGHFSHRLIVLAVKD